MNFCAVGISAPKCVRRRHYKSAALSGTWGEHQTGLAGSAAGQKSMALAEFGQMEVLETN